jgi:hypothetical protein
MKQLSSLTCKDRRVLLEVLEQRVLQVQAEQLEHLDLPQLFLVQRVQLERQAFLDLPQLFLDQRVRQEVLAQRVRQVRLQLFLDQRVQLDPREMSEQLEHQVQQALFLAQLVQLVFKVMLARQVHKEMLEQLVQLEVLEQVEVRDRKV